jgi:signal transduction histidine kinase
VAIHISDNGVGIPPQLLSKIFDPFFTTKPMGQGTGLGMSISRQIIAEKHGGSIDCRSQTGRGTEFIIRLPVNQKVHLREPQAAVAAS